MIPTLNSQAVITPNQAALKAIKLPAIQTVSILNTDGVQFSAQKEATTAKAATPIQFGWTPNGTVTKALLKTNEWMTKPAKSKELKHIQQTVSAVNAFDTEMSTLSNEGFKEKTAQFKARLAQVPQTGDPKIDRVNEDKVLAEILPEAFALVKEAAWRIYEMKHYDVQLMTGILLNKGQIVEMKTGEGKTLAATTAAYLNALSGKGVQIMTPNDYLAARDAEWAKPLFNFLGLSVGAIVESDRENKAAKKEAYAADITYCNATEFGFDYLRDNLANDIENLVQRPFHYAIVDEADHILIDVARNPLVMSGGDTISNDADTAIIKAVQNVVEDFEEGVDYEIDWTEGFIGLINADNVNEKSVGEQKVCDALGIDSLYTQLPNGMSISGYVTKALTANFLKEEGVDYEIKMVADKQTGIETPQVIIVNESTGRLQIGSKWSEGLHQAVEAKEGVAITHENKKLASVTYQNLFRMYPKLSGMTGTALSADAEFTKVYDMPPVTEIPTHKPNLRTDIADQVFTSTRAKFHRVVENVLEMHRTGRPILIGTASVDDSIDLANLLTDSSEMTQFLKDFAINTLAALDKPLKENNPNLVNTLTQLSQSPKSITPDQVNTLAKKYDTQAKQMNVLPVINRLSKARSKKIELAVIAKDLTQMANTLETIIACDTGVLKNHNLLNAKQDKNEADIVAQAGRLNAITIATNMAGRGTDIKLGGDAEKLTEMQFVAEGRNLEAISDAEFSARLNKNEVICKTNKKKVIELGGLHVIGTQRHDDRRIDNQLRGRAGRQGDPGSSQFYVSFQDDIVRETNLDKILATFKDYDNQPYAMQHELASKVINMAQDEKQMKALEGRKNILDYDDVYQAQRVTWYTMRHELLTASTEDILNSLTHITQTVATRMIKSHIEDFGDSLNESEATALTTQLNKQYPIALNLTPDVFTNKTGKEAASILTTTFKQLFAKNMGEDDTRLASVTKQILLEDLTVNLWQSHLKELEIMQAGINFRSVAQKDPKVEFQHEAFAMFSNLKEVVQESLIRVLLGTWVETKTLV